MSPINISEKSILGRGKASLFKVFFNDSSVWVIEDLFEYLFLWICLLPHLTDLPSLSPSSPACFLDSGSLHRVTFSFRSLFPCLFPGRFTSTLLCLSGFALLPCCCLGPWLLLQYALVLSVITLIQGKPFRAKHVQNEVESGKVIPRIKISLY